MILSTPLVGENKIKGGQYCGLVVMEKNKNCHD